MIELSIVLDDKYWKNWEKSLSAKDKLWAKVCSAKNRKDRSEFYEKWLNFEIRKPFIFR